MNVPTAQAPPSESCGPPYVCDVSFWVGETAEIDGDSGIAQTGFDAQVQCSLLCGYTDYPVWYEFYSPSSSGATNCFEASAGDTIRADVSYSSGTYYTSIYDDTSSKSCTSSQSMSMGAPVYAQWIVENPGYSGGYYDTPPYTPHVTFQDMGVGSSGDLPALNPFNYGNYGEPNSAKNVWVSDITYGNSSCIAFWSCFSADYV